MAAAAISCLIQILRPFIQNEVGMLWGVDKEMKKLSSTFSAILAVLDDAELQQVQQRALKDWLRKLKDAAYEVRDILDDCATEASRWEYESQNCASLRKVWTCYPVQNLYFRHNISNRMKDVIEDLDAIAQERIKFHLNERIPEKLIEYDERRETSSSHIPSEVIGRKDEKNHIVKVLTVDIRHSQDVSVYPIIGMGGLGKTTLAQMVINDQETIKSHFEPKVWVYVSPDFSVKRVMNLIIESISGQNPGISSLDSLHKKVQEMLSGKRYLLVLDDIWNEDQEEWDKLKSSLSCGAPGACILATTRSEKVTSIIRTLPANHLSELSEDDCWLLFRQRAFGPDNEELPDLVAIGKEIVKKCGGVPLAAKALGGLMRSKMEVTEWVNVKESDLWDLPQGEVPILPALRLSYYHLPLQLRHCFSYFAVFPKGSRLEKEKIIQLWMANGFISSSGKLEVEDVGNVVWNELYKRSLFLDDKGGMFMHDLVHDLARSIIEDECYTMEAESSGIIHKQKIRHVTLISDSKRSAIFPEALGGQKELHTILLQARGQSSFTKLEGKFSCDFKNLGSLRAFDANGAKMRHLSKSIGNSKHLTYLNLSVTAITELPGSICSLHHLQTINLNYCWELRRLPEKMHGLTGLRHLCLKGCDKIEGMPWKIGKLRQLKTLSLFVVGDGERLGELQYLELGGELELRHLERVQNSMEAKEANLDGKHNLRVLCLSWGGRYNWRMLDERIVVEEEEIIMEGLKPHPNIRELRIEGYGGKELASWMSDPSVLRNVVRITISSCCNCLGLPPALCHLPCLKRLEVRRIGRETEYMFQNGNNLSVGLEELVIKDIQNLKGLWSMEVEEEEEGAVHQQQQTQLLFPRLRSMHIWNCPQLVALPILPAIQELEIYYSSSVALLAASVSKLTTLTSLGLYGNEEMVCLPEEMLQNLTLLQSLSIWGFRSLKVLPENISRLIALKKLIIFDCKKLEDKPNPTQLQTRKPTISLGVEDYDMPEDGVSAR